jgi:hypothetical protein
LAVRKLFVAVLLLLCTTTQNWSQTVSVPLSHWAYETIERWEIQGKVQTVYNGTKPFTRNEMAEYISEVWENYTNYPDKFSNTDTQQLFYLITEFREELQKTEDNFNRKNWTPRINRLFQIQPFKTFNNFLYKNDRNLLELNYKEFNFYLDPILSYSSQELIDEEKGKSNQIRTSNGLLFRGNLGKYFGYFFHLTDNHVNDSRLSGQKFPYEVWEESGWPYLTRSESGKIDFDENVSYFTLTYKYFHLLYGREYNQWGIGHQGNILLSTNSQMTDQIKLVIRYWRFKFTHITSFLQYISQEARISMNSQPHIDNYWSGNRLEIDFGKGVQIGLSQAVVYGDRSLQLGYLNPLSFYKSMEHYYGDRDNGALGIDMEWRILPGLKIFGEWFIDDITTTKLGSNFYGNKFAWQTGFFIVNPFSISDTDVLIEYVRIKPYVYSHTLQDYNKYKHYDTILGHYIGPNSDDIFIRLQKRFSKYLQIGLEYEYYRHGSNSEEINFGGDPDRPHQEGDAIDAPFLDGIRQTQKTYGGFISYEFIRNLIAEIHYHNMKFNSRDWEQLLSFRISFNFGYKNENFRHIFPATY